MIMSSMTNDEFKILRDLIQRESSIFLSDCKKDFLKSRVERRLRALNMQSVFQYYKFVSDQSRDELDIFIDTVTINETNFFRNASQFDLFRGRILPGLIETKRRTGDYSLKIWSAGCSTGEEPYSISMEVLEAIPDLSRWNIKIIASDISLRCLDTASKGRYSSERLKDVPDKYITRFFNQAGEHCEIKDSVKRLIVFDYHNLKHDNGLTGLDIIFCRNVMIYFNIKEQRELIARFSGMLSTGGYLFLGHAETLQDTEENLDFKFIYWSKGAAYQKMR